MNNQLRMGNLLLLALLLAACGGPPQNNPLLEEVRTDFNSASEDTSIVRYAPVALAEAEEVLQEGIRLWEAKEDKVMVEHQIYLAKQKTAIARETAKLNMAQVEIERAEPERQRILIEVRRAEAARSEERALAALEEARSEREAAEQARQRAEELAKRVNELEARQTERGLVLTLGDVLYNFDSANLQPGGYRVVDELATFLKEYPERNILIEGFTDSIGDESYNENLSRRRAASLQQALVENQINSSRIQIRGYGERFPVASNQTEAGRQQNRRVEVIISDQDGTIPERTN